MPGNCGQPTHRSFSEGAGQHVQSRHERPDISIEYRDVLHYPDALRGVESTHGFDCVSPLLSVRITRV